MVAAMPSWVPDAVFYSFLPDRLEPPRPEELAGYARGAFEAWDEPPAHRAYKGGTLRGAVRHLDRLADLGVTALFLTPIGASPSYHRYKPLDLTTIDPRLGGERAFAELLAAVRARGMRLVLDLVVNHVGVGALPFADVVELGARSPYRDWFHVSSFPVRPYAGAPTYRCWNGNPSMPVLDHANPAARAYVVSAAEAWAKRGVDGLRLDAASEVEAPVLFEELRAAVKRHNPECYLVGETWTDPSAYLDGRQWDGATNYPLHFTLRELCGGGRLDPAHAHPGSLRAGGIDAAEAAHRLELLLGRHPWHHTLRQLNFIDGHDVARLRTLAGGDAATGELAALLLYTLPGAPCMYYGEEVGMVGGMPPDNRRGFPSSEAWDRECLRRYGELIALRRAHPALRTGSYRTLVTQGGALAFLRQRGEEALVVAVNVGDDAARVEIGGAHLPAGAPRPRWGAAGLEVADGRLVLALAPRSGVVVQLGAAGAVPAVDERALATSAGRDVSGHVGACAAAVMRAGAHESPPQSREVVVVGNIGVDTNVYLPTDSFTGALESSFTDDLDTIGQAGGYTSFGLAALGRAVGFVGYLGDDALGRWVEAELAAAGIDRLLFTDPAGTQRSVNLMARDGTRKNFYDGKSHMRLHPDLLRCAEFFDGARLAHFHLPNWARQLLPLARARGLVISTDLQDTTSPDDPYRQDFIVASDFLFCSAVNLDPRDLSAALLARNPRAVVVLGMGARGAGLATVGGFRHFPPVDLPRPVIDTNGAGDSLAVGFLVAHVLEGRSLEESIRWGQLAARWACTERAKWRRLITRPALDALLG